MPAAHKNILAALAIALVAVACASASSTQETTAEALDRIIADGHRPAADRERDVYRHPKDTLLFFGLRPQMQVVEVWPEPGWYTEIIAPLVKDQGKYYAALAVPRPDNTYVTARLKAYAERFAARPDIYGKIALILRRRALSTWWSVSATFITGWRAAGRRRLLPICTRL
jgi:predicted methyltransferase